jgi:hypothetical protein
MSIRINTTRISVVAGAFAAMLLFAPDNTSAYEGPPRNVSVSNPLRTEFPQSEQPSGYGTTDYDRLLRTYVNEQGWVDYVGLARERTALNRFLEELASISPKEFKDQSERLAFWINAYNACTLADVLDTVYGKHKSVRQVRGFFDGKQHLVAGEKLTLDEIEKRGRELHDPRIHFAIVCASASCPTLQRFAYTGQALDRQLDQAARDFLADPNRGLRFDREHNQLSVSPIFEWYAGDFMGVSGGAGSLWARAKATVAGSELLDFIASYAPEEISQLIPKNRPTLHYSRYDWSLNSLDSHPAGGKP